MFRCMIVAIVVVIPCLALAAPVQFQLEDGTIVELDIDGVPVGGKVTGKVVWRDPKARQKPAPVRIQAPNAPVPAAAPIPRLNYSGIVTTYLKGRVNDADRLQIVNIGEPIPLEKCLTWEGGDDEEDKFLDTPLWSPVRTPGVAVVTKFRATNALGALVLAEHAILINTTGKVFRTVDKTDFRTSRPAMKSDPFMDQFLGLSDGSGLTGRANPPKPRPQPDGTMKPDRNEPSRLWKSVDGKSVAGRFIEYKDDHVFVAAAGGRVVSLPLESLSRADQIYIERRALGR